MLRTLPQSELTIANRIRCWRPVAVALTGIVLIVAFAQAPLKVQGRIVEFVTLGDWPMEWAARKLFRDKHTELGAIVEFLAENPEIIRLSVAPISVVPTGLRAVLDEAPATENDYDNPNILEALRSVYAERVAVYEDQVRIVLGEEVRSGTSFLAYFALARLQDYEIASCEEIDADRREKPGACGFPLANSWLLVYEWRPLHPDELQPASHERSD